MQSDLMLMEIEICGINYKPVVIDEHLSIMKKGAEIVKHKAYVKLR